MPTGPAPTGVRSAQGSCDWGHGRRSVQGHGGPVAACHHHNHGYHHHRYPTCAPRLLTDCKPRVTGEGVRACVRRARACVLGWGWAGCRDRCGTLARLVCESGLLVWFARNMRGALPPADRDRAHCARDSVRPALLGLPRRTARRNTLGETPPVSSRTYILIEIGTPRLSVASSLPLALASRRPRRRSLHTSSACSSACSMAGSSACRTPLVPRHFFIHFIKL